MLKTATVAFTALALSLCLPACGKKDKDDKKTTKKKPPKDLKKNAKPLTDLFKKGPVSLIGPAAGVEIGGDFEAQKKKLDKPQMFSRDGEDYFDWGGDKKGGIRFTVNKDKTKVGYVEVEFARHTNVKDAIVGAWGSPTMAAHWTMKGPKGKIQVPYWFNPDKGLRAYYHEEGNEVGKQKLLIFERYQPFAKLIGDGPDMAFQTAPILGQKEDEIKKAYKDYDPKFGISMAPVEWNPKFTQVFVRYAKDGTAKNYRIPLKLEFNPKAKDLYMAALEKKYGKPTVEAGKGKDPDVHVFRKEKPRVVAYVNNDILSIVVGKK